MQLVHVSKVDHNENEQPFVRQVFICFCSRLRLLPVFLPCAVCRADEYQYQSDFESQSFSSKQLRSAADAWKG